MGIARCVSVLAAITHNIHDLATALGTPHEFRYLHLTGWLPAYLSAAAVSRLHLITDC
jgi:hypothetical protein